jgi:hypothetical protein
MEQNPRVETILREAMTARQKAHEDGPT